MRNVPCGLVALGEEHPEHTWGHDTSEINTQKFRCDGIKTAPVTLFKQGGKFYTSEKWRIPEGAIGPWDMEKSPDFRRIDNGPVLIDGEPWGYYPHLLPSVETHQCGPSCLRGF